jgi:hypothetical protein
LLISPDVPVLFVLSIVLFVVFFFYERYLEQHTSLPPAAKPSVFTRNGGRFSFLMVIAFSAFLSTGGWFYAATIYYQNLLGYSALKNALHTLPSAIAGISVGVSAPRQATS